MPYRGEFEMIRQSKVRREIASRKKESRKREKNELCAFTK
jgi:hypothetical protein